MEIERPGSSKPPVPKPEEAAELQSMFASLSSPARLRDILPPALGIDSDIDRFRRIVKGKIKSNLKDYMTRKEMIGKRDKDIVTIPVDSIEIPHFAHDEGGEQGVSQGEGDEGQQIPGQPQKPGKKGGEGRGQHSREQNISIEELAEIMGEELKLPRIQPKGKDSIETVFTTWNDISRTGPDSQRHNKRSFKEALKRTITSGDYDPDDPMIVISPPDYRYRAPKVKPKPKMNAAIIYLMDVSGSMGENEKEIARMVSFWIDLWLDANYKGCEKAFVIHDDGAQEVDRETFFTTTESGGTRISTGLELVNRIIKDRFNPDEWNIYIVQFSDGENLGSADNEHCMQIIEEQLLPFINLYAYGQIGKGTSFGTDFGDDLTENFDDRKDMAIARIKTRDDIPNAIKRFFTEGN